MEYVIVIFFLGLMVTLVVAKGLLMANEYAASERDSRAAFIEAEKRGPSSTSADIQE